jgi:protein arginine N-methyltransferase 7
MQAIYYPKNVLNLNKNDKFYVKCNHDEYSLYFDLISNQEYSARLNKISTIEKFVSENKEISNEDERSLGLTLVSRNRLAQLNDTKRNDMFLNLLQNVI